MNVFKKLTVASTIVGTVLLSACSSSDEPEPRSLDGGSSESATVEARPFETFGDLDEDDRAAADWLISTASLNVCPGNNSIYTIGENGGSMIPEGYEIQNFVDSYTVAEDTKAKLSAYSDIMKTSALFGAGQIDAPNASDYDYVMYGCSGDPNISTEGGSKTKLEDFFTVSDDETKLTLAFDKVRIIDLLKSPEPRTFRDGVDKEDFEELRGGHARAEFVLDLENNTLEMTDDSWLKQVM